MPATLNASPNPGRDEDALDDALNEATIDPTEAARAWDPADRTPEAARKRRAEVADDFWAFDTYYFPPVVYRQGYAPPADFHRAIVRRAQTPGLHVELAARKHGKTVTLKKVLAWLLLTARVHLAGTLSQTLPTSRGILDDVRRFIADNPRIAYDYEPTFVVANDDQFAFRTHNDSALRHCAAFSEGRSLRGFSKGFARPEWVVCDDLETRQSPLSERPVERRAKFLAESFTSLAGGGTLMVAGNNFDRRCLMNRLLTKQEEGTLPDDWAVHVAPAWTDDRGPLWPERFPAESKAELRRLLDPYDDEEWAGDFQQQPQPPSGRFFKRTGYRTFSGLPGPQARGVLYCDPNLSKKGKGDTTAIVALFYDASADQYLVPYARCQSYSDSNALLDDVLEAKRRFGHRLAALGFDGHVTQESTWTNNVRHWCRTKGLPFPTIQWCRYDVGALAKNTQMAWKEGRIAFPAGFSETEEGKRFLAQTYAFTGRKRSSGAKDDAPDALICAFELLHDRLAVRRGQHGPSDPIVVHDPIQF